MAKQRRGNGEGSLTQRKDGLWQAAITIPGSGRVLPKKKYKYAKTRAAAAVKLTELQHLVSTNALPASNPSFEAYTLEWLELKRTTVRESSWVNYELACRRHFIPYFGAKKLASISGRHIQSLYSHLLQKGLSATSVSGYSSILANIFKRAQIDDLIQKNPVRLAVPPKKERKEIPALTDTEIQRLVEASRGHRLHAQLVLALSVGCRLGEILGLRWTDLNLTNGTLSIERTLKIRPVTGAYFTPPKTASSIRVIDISQSPFVLKVLTQHKERQVAERKQALKDGRRWDASSDLIFPNQTGTPQNPKNAARYYRPWFKDAGLEGRGLDWHALRHIATSTMVSKGVPFTVISAVLGHSSPEFTFRIYSHLVPDDQGRAAQTMDAVLAG